jgi:hypothetical protein
MRREVPLAIALVSGLTWIFTTYITGPKLFTTVRSELNNWFLLVQGWMVFVGVINLSRVHMHKIQQKKQDWLFSIVCLVSAFGMVLFGLFVIKDLNDPNWKNVFRNIIAPMSASVYATLLFFIASAAYRAFQVRNSQATILLVAAVVTMIGRVPLGAMIHPVLPQVADWIMNVPNVAGMRGIGLGAAFGGIATALRVLTGIERGYMGGTE